MAKKQIRLNSPEAIAEKIAGQEGKYINVVLKNGRVYPGYVQPKGKNDHVNIKNTLGHKQSFELSEIEEIIIDYKD